MPIVFTYDDQTLDVDDVPMDVYADIQKRTGVEWYQLSARPMAHAAAGQMLARECAQLLGVELPDKLTPKLFVKLFDVVEEPNLPTEFEEGMPDPLVRGSDQETT